MASSDLVMRDRDCVFHGLMLLALGLIITATALAGYKAKTWSPRQAASYPAKLTSEKITIAAEPLYQDAQAAEVFDKNDIVTAGIMPLAIVIFNDNDFAVRIEASTIELIEGEEHLHTRVPGEVVYGLFKKGRGAVWGVPSSRLPTGGDVGNPEALKDFDRKFLGSKVIPAHGTDGGFLYIHPLVAKDLASYLAKTRIYIPDLFRHDNGNKMMFFEFDLKPAVTGASVK